MESLCQSGEIAPPAPKFGGGSFGKASPGGEGLSADLAPPNLGAGGAKILTADALAQTVAARQNRGETVVFTNGVFDVLHVGHARYLAEARKLGDALIVAVNSDASVRGLKGPTRPVVSEDERTELLAALACVDYVVIFDTPTPVPLLEMIRPKIYVKGGDYRIDVLPETSIVRSYGGEVRILQFVPGRSTTDLISRIRNLTS